MIKADFWHTCSMDKCPSWDELGDWKWTTCMSVDPDNGEGVLDAITMAAMIMHSSTCDYDSPVITIVYMYVAVPPL